MKIWKTKLRRGLALFLALVMCVSMLQLTVFAGESGGEEQEIDVYALTCETEAHLHGEDCYTLTCKDENHAHTQKCYTLTCDKAEHVHMMGCYELQGSYPDEEALRALLTPVSVFDC